MHSGVITRLTNCTEHMFKHTKTLHTVHHLDWVAVFDSIQLCAGDILHSDQSPEVPENSWSRNSEGGDPRWRAGRHGGPGRNRPRRAWAPQGADPLVPRPQQDTDSGNFTKMLSHSPHAKEHQDRSQYTRCFLHTNLVLFLRLAFQHLLCFLISAEVTLLM